MALKKITPVHEAIYALNQAIKELKLHRDQLRALLPPVKPSKAKGYIRDPFTGKKLYYKYNNKRT